MVALRAVLVTEADVNVCHMEQSLQSICGVNQTCSVSKYLQRLVCMQ